MRSLPASWFPVLMALWVLSFLVVIPLWQQEILVVWVALSLWLAVTLVLWVLHGLAQLRASLDETQRRITAVRDATADLERQVGLLLRELRGE